ncbi:MAG: DHA2 family efflux MFS transporter permease subunit [Deltaproteobacteria bacterium]|jgi:DHA2 family multidrug resistance protein|nr:DHA2 family efflux MFS transporter permease subunit [Deltaproteobacteria bacterium]
MAAIALRAGDSLPPITARERAILTFALPLATFMMVVDLTITNVALPTIAGNLGASYTQGTWIITSYSVTNAIALPLTGRLAKRYGEVRLFLASTALFALASVCCGLAPNITALVLFRVFQGAAGGPMIPLAQSLLINNYPKEKKVMALALWSMTVSVAPVIGPILGGAISDSYHWSWIFFINAPFGAIVVYCVAKVLYRRDSPTSPAPFGTVNFLFLALGVGALQTLLDKGKELDWFHSDLIVALAVVAVVGITLLIVWERRDPDPIIDLSLFKSRNYSVGAALISLGMMLYMGTVVLLPLLLQTWHGYTATWAGLALAPIGLFPIVLTPLIGRYSRRPDLRPVVTLSFLIFAGCMFARTSFAPQADLKFVVLPQLIQGLALATFFVPLTALAFMDTPREKMASAAGLFNCVRTLFGGVGASVATTLWERREAFHHTRLVENIDGINPLSIRALESLQSMGLGESEALGYLSREITKQGYIFAGAEIFQLCAFAFLAMIAVVWLARTQRGA